MGETLPDWVLNDWGSLEQNIAYLQTYDSYSSETDQALPAFRYDRDNDKYRIIKEHYPVSQTAGTGPDFDRAMRVSEWMCDNIPPGGDNGLEADSLTLLGHAYRRERHGTSDGLDCFQFSILFTELLFCVGIISRPVWLEGFDRSRKGNHWANIIWSREQCKWIMIDSMFNACFRTAEGDYCHPLELRQALASGMYVTINDNWGSRNYDWSWDEATLLDFYGKNLFCMGSPLINSFRSYSRPDNRILWLIPENFDPGHSGQEKDAYPFMGEKHIITGSHRTFFREPDDLRSR